jgi:hypothetical protein
MKDNESSLSKLEFATGELVSQFKTTEPDAETRAHNPQTEIEYSYPERVSPEDQAGVFYSHPDRVSPKDQPDESLYTQPPLLNQNRNSTWNL